MPYAQNNHPLVTCHAHEWQAGTWPLSALLCPVLEIASLPWLQVLNMQQSMLHAAMVAHFVWGRFYLVHAPDNVRLKATGAGAAFLHLIILQSCTRTYCKSMRSGAYSR
jgi:hypothetical protein